MKVMTILGSPRKNGNTAKALGWVEEHLRSKGHHVVRVNIADCDLKGCRECYTCQEPHDELNCPTDDDAKAVFEQMIASDIVVFASPLFCWDFPAQMKPLIDRHFCLATGFGTPQHRSLIEGKRVALLVTAGGPVEDNADLIVEVFNRVSAFTRTRIVARLVVPLCTTPGEMGESVRRMACDFACGIVEGSKA